MIFTSKDQSNFAELSQDFNPMHCDEVLSRRYIYGEPVVHGINAMIFAIKEWSNLITFNFLITSLKCKFTKPIFLDKKISIDIKNINDSIKINLLHNNEIRMTIKLEIIESDHEEFYLREYDSHTNNTPNDIAFNDLADYSRTIECTINTELAKKYYTDEFINKIGFIQLAEILSFSRIVGMHSPGLNSIFSELNFYNHTSHNNDIFFKVKSLDERFNIVNIESIGPNFISNIRAFYRPIQVNQKKISEIKKDLKKNEFKDFRALVIGASRGLGEFTAKCLGYGGASLLLTYAKGKDDILNVVDDIQIYNKNISILELDITKTSEMNYELINQFNPTHVFYYATPFIFNATKNKFSDEIYKKFKLFYFDAFKNIVENLAISKNKTYFLYPSSIAVEEKPVDMLEYSLAKKEGEDLCLILEKQYSNIKIYCPRLPRLETDQTVSLSSVNNQDPIKILDIIRSMNKKPKFF